MKMTNYRLQTEVENISEDKKKWFKQYMRDVLESEKPYYSKADYIGLSFKELENKIKYISEDIKELQALKQKLSKAKVLAMEAAAEVLSEYGITRIDGTVISSITVAAQKIKLKEYFEILDEKALVDLGFCKTVVDEEAVKEAMSIPKYMNKIANYVESRVEQETAPAKIKVNTRKSNNSMQRDEFKNSEQSQYLGGE
jgi:hypothetical protein